MPTPVGGELPDDAEEPRALGRGQRRGRLVHDQDPRLERQRLGDLDELLLADAQPRDPRLRVELDAEPVEQPPRRPRTIARRSRTMPGDQRLAAEKDVRGDARAPERGSAPGG